jgi:hypothetical protein
VYKANKVKAVNSKLTMADVPVIAAHLMYADECEPFLVSEMAGALDRCRVASAAGFAERVDSLLAEASYFEFISPNN